MIETILQGVPLLAMALSMAFIVIVVVIGCMFGIAWLWDRNRVLGISVEVTCIVVAFLLLSYLIGSAVG